MKANSKFCALAAIIVMVILALPYQLVAGAKSSAANKSSKAQWSLQVDKINPGDVDLESAFQVAIYENLLDELGKTKQFKQVFRSGDRNANAKDVPNLLLLKTTVQKYTAGSETKRAVTTVSGATKLNVLSQLCARDGKVVLELTVEGDVHFFGSNLRATHNLAKNVAKKIKESTLPDPSPVASASVAEGAASDATAKRPLSR
ncbi:MAG TPA: hypothetical protein VJK27_02680 [Terriglobales bacterium]|nr:hypothetical protein [Terriglobales bacterium]